MTYIFRPGHYNVSADAEVYEPGAAALPWWNPDGATPAATCGAWQAKGAASLAESYLNLATLGNANIDPAVVGGVAPTWAVGTGWTFNGITHNLRTGIIPANTTWSVLLAFSGYAPIGNGKTFCGAYTNDTNLFLLQNLNSGGYANSLRPCNGALAGYAPQIASGVYGFAGKQAYRNGLPEAGAIPAGGTPSALQQFLGALNFGGAAVQHTAFNLIAWVIYNVTLTAPQVLARATAMAAL